MTCQDQRLAPDDRQAQGETVVEVLSLAVTAVRSPGSGTSGSGTPRAGVACPRCGRGRLDYDGLLNLGCPECGYTAGSGGCFR